MKNQLYKRLLNLASRNDSTYYGGNYINPIENPASSWAFIENYFKKGQKQAIFDVNFIDDLKKDGKHKHTISMYFIGILLKELANKALAQNLGNKIENSLEWYSFEYSWFLSCLFHDVAFVFEKSNKIKRDDNISANDFYEMIKRELKIEYDVYQCTDIAKSMTYSIETVKKYLHYIYLERNAIEHGIVGGLLLFDRLKKNFIKHQQEYISTTADDLQINIDSFVYKGVSWRKEHLNHFGFVADTIISHNIWYSTNKDLYLDFGLELLIQSDANKLSFKTKPLLVFLAVLDTIEPSKINPAIEIIELWRKLDLSLDSSSNIKIDLLDKTFNFEQYIEKIRSLQDWIDVQIVHKGNRITISLM